MLCDQACRRSRNNPFMSPVGARRSPRGGAKRRMRASFQFVARVTGPHPNPLPRAVEGADIADAHHWPVRQSYRYPAGRLGVENARKLSLQKIQFEIIGPRPKLSQCHCSLCRKRGGSSSNALIVVDAENFGWLAGERLISSYRKATGFRSDFCAQCGSPVPRRRPSPPRTRPVAKADPQWPTELRNDS